MTNLMKLRQKMNRYHAAHTDRDIAALAGLDAAEAVLSGDRSTFDRHFEPEGISIQSGDKIIGFKVPLSSES